MILTETNTDWRARPAADSFDDYPPRSGDDNWRPVFSSCYPFRPDVCGQWYRDSYRDGPPEHGSIRGLKIVMMTEVAETMTEATIPG